VLVAGALLAGCGDSPEQMLSSAKTFIDKKDYNAAVIQLKNALQEDNNLIEARYLLGKIYFERGEMANAVKEFQHALRLGYEGEDITPMLARALVQQGQRDEVIKTYSGTALKDPKALSDLLTVLGDARITENREEAERDYREAMKSNPDNPHAKLGLARVYALAGRMDDAIALVNEVVTASPKVPQAYALKGQLLFSRQDFDGGIAAFRDAISIDPKEQRSHYSLVNTLIQMGRADEARAGLDHMIKEVGKTPLTYYLEAFLSFRQNKLTLARDAIQEVERLAPNFIPARMLAGAIYYRLGDQLQSQTNLAKVLEADPKNIMARRMLVLSYVAQRDAARAVDTLEPLLEADPDSSETLAIAGQVYLLAGDFERSSKYFARQVAKTPDDARAMTRLGISRLAAGEIDRGLNDLGEASQLDADLSYADFARVTAMLSEHKFDEALKAQAELEKKLPNNPLTYNLRGGIMIGKGDLVAARAAFRKALEVNPDFLPAATNLARLAFRDGKADEARKIYQDLLARNPKRADVLLSLADLEQAAGGNADLVRKYLEGAVEAGPRMISPRVRLVDFLLAQNKRTEALTAAREAQAVSPEHPGVLRAIGHALMANGDFEQAVTAFQKRADQLTENGGAFLDLGRALYMAGNIRAAEQALKRAKTLEPKLLDSYQLLVAIAMKDKRFDDAERLAKELQAGDPKSGLGYLFEGDVIAARGDWKSALPVFQKSYELSPNVLTAVKLHSALVRSDRRPDADKVASDWMAAHPDDLTMKAYLAEYALANKQYDKAYQLYVDIDAQAPDRPSVLNNLAWVASQRNDPKAIEFARRALALAPESPAILDTAGMIEVAQGDVEAGVRKVEKAVQLSPKTPAIRLNLARAYIKAGRKDDARNLLDALTGEYPVGNTVYEEANALRKTL
jgi:putative PEP-CTERM system TPR-repeat lipoprotein